MVQSLRVRDATEDVDLCSNNTSGTVTLAHNNTGYIRVGGPSNNIGIFETKADGSQYLGDGVTTGKIVLGNGTGASARIYIGNDGGDNGVAGAVTVRRDLHAMSGISFDSGSNTLSAYAHTETTALLVLHGTGTLSTTPTWTEQAIHTTRIGSFVFYTFHINWTGSIVATTGTDTLSLSGLQWTPADGDDETASFSSTGIDIKTSETLFAFPNPATDELDLYVYSNSGAHASYTAATASLLQANGRINICGSYHI